MEEALVSRDHFPDFDIRQMRVEDAVHQICEFLLPVVVIDDDPVLGHEVVEILANQGADLSGHLADQLV